MGALDQVKSYFTGDVNIDDPGIRQALKQAFPSLAKAGSEFDDLEYLPSAYIQEKIVPALMIMDEAHLQTFKSSIEKTSTDLHSLAKDIESSLRYKPRDGNAVPSNQQIPDRIKSSTKSAFKDAKDFITDMTNLRTDAEKEQALMAEIIASANRSVVKFDQYVSRGDDKQYGNKANDWFEIDSMNRNIRRPANSKKIRHNVENVPKIDFVTVVNDVVAMAQEPSVNVNIEGKMQPVGGGTRIEKLAYLASWMSALEEGCDTVLPNMLAEATTTAATTVVNTTVGTGVDVVSGVFDEWPIATTAMVAMIGYATYKTGALVKGVLSIGGVPFKAISKVAGMFPVTRAVAPFLDRVGNMLSFGDKLPVAGASGTAGSTTEGPKTPDRFVEVNPADLKDFGPGEANHEEYYKKTVEKIKSLSTTPAVPTAGAPAPAITSAEVTKRTSLFMRLDKEYRANKMSLAEYLKRAEDIIAGRGRVLVVDHAGVVDKAETIQNVKQRLADRIPVVNQFTRNNPNGSAALSVSAMQEAKKRIKGASYESVDYAGAKVEFADAANRILFEEFRDKLQKYTEMQEWDANDRRRIAKEGLKTQIQTVDIPAKQAEIALKAGQIAVTPQLIPGPPMVMPGATTPIPTQIANPLIATLNGELSDLQSNLKQYNADVSRINGEIATIRGEVLPYSPSAGGRSNFQTDMRALKLELSSPGATTGLIQRINAAVGAGTIPESAFDRKALKIDKIRLLEVIKTALKK